MNDQTLDLRSEFCELSLFSSKIKVRSSYLIFPEQILTTAETHFIPIHISLSFFWFSLEKLIGSEHKQLVVTYVLLNLGVTQIAFQLRLFLFSFFSFSTVFLDGCTKAFTYVSKIVTPGACGQYRTDFIGDIGK